MHLQAPRRISAGLTEPAIACLEPVHFFYQFFFLIINQSASNFNHDIALRVPVHLHPCVASGTARVSSSIRLPADRCRACSPTADRAPVHIPAGAALRFTFQLIIIIVYFLCSKDILDFF